MIMHDLSFYDINMYKHIVKIFKSNGIFTVRVDDLGDKLRLTGFNLNKTILTQIYVGEEYYFLDEGGCMYLNLDFGILRDNFLGDINNSIPNTNDKFVVSQKKDKDYNIYNKYYFTNLIDWVKYKTEHIDQNMREYIDGKIDKSLSKGEYKIRIDTDKLRNAFNVLYYSDGVYFSVFNNRLSMDTDDCSFSLACDNKSDNDGSNMYKPSELYSCLRYLPSDRITLRFDETSPLFIKSKYKAMTIEHTISPLQEIDKEL